MTDLVTVIVPVYQVAEILLRKSIESILQQTYSNIELLIVDDGSPDNAGEICDDYAKSDNRIKVFHTTNGGVSNARNYALDRASGEYVFFVDSDDYLEPSCIDVLLEQQKKHNSDCAMCSAYHVGEVDIIRVDEQTDTKLECIVMNQQKALGALCYMEHPYAGYEYSAIWGCLYKRRAIANIRFNTKMKIGEDFEFKYRVFLNMKSFLCVNGRYYNYLIRSNSAMRSGFDASKVDSIEELEKLIVSSNLEDCKIERLKSRAVNIAIVMLFMIPLSKEYEEYRKRIKKFIMQYRRSVLLNKLTRKKVRVALLISYLGFDFTQRLFNVAKANQ